MSAADAILSDKRVTIERMLDAGAVMVHVDARAPDVTVPPKFVHEHDLVLCLSLRVRESRVCVGKEGIDAVLHFSAGPFRCILPWGTIIAVYCEATGEACVWNGDALHLLRDVPPEPRPALTLIRGGRS